MSACARNVEPAEPESVQVTVTASLEGNDMTRTTVQDGGTQVYWETGEEIKVFFRNSIGRFISQNTELARTADFTGAFSAVVGSNEGEASSHLIWGLYPFRADATYDGSSVTTTLPSAQTGRAGSFAKNTNITIAQSVGLNLAFYNVCGGLRFSLTQEGIKRITFEGNNGEALAGKIKIAFEDGVPVVSEVVAKDSVLTLTAPNGGTFQTGVWYYLSAIPGTLSGGYKMVFYKESESAKLTSTSSVRIKRGIFGSLADADEDLVFKPTGGGDEPNPEDAIVFADEKVRQKLVAAFDANGDGELSYAEAAAVTSGDAVKSAFGAIKTYKSFDEFQYFTGITRVSAGMFENWNVLTSVILPDNVTYIGSSSFNNCVKLSSIVLPESVTIIGVKAFEGCSGLSSIVIPDGLTSIGQYAFYGCSSLSVIIIPASVTSIWDYAFYGCSSLSSIVIPEGVTSIRSYAFRGCTKLSSIVIPESVTSIGQYAFYGCSSLSSIVIPESLTSIGEGAFSGCSILGSIVIPEGVTSIENSVFQGCTGLTSMIIPESVTSIWNYAFYGCSSLSSIVIPESVTSIGEGAFSGCSSLSSIVIPEGVTSISEEAFYGCSSLSSITIPESVTSIGKSAFSGCSSLSSIVIPESVTSIGQAAFCRCSSLSSIVIPESVTSIGRSVFSGCVGLSSIVIPESVTSIGIDAFSGCTGLSSIVIPESVTSISEEAFYGCTALSSIVIPERVTSIGRYTFWLYSPKQHRHSRARDKYREVYFPWL